MKKLSSELLKSYFIILALFFMALVGINLALRHHLAIESMSKVKQVQKFLLDELIEEEHQNIEDFYENAVLESPKEEDLFINIRFASKEFKEKKSPSFDKKESPGKLVKIGDFYVLNTKMKLLNGEAIDVQIIKGFKVEEKFLNEVCKISVIGFIFVFILSYFIQRYFYLNITGQFEKIKEATAKVNLGDFKVAFQKESFFEEFSTVFKAYEEMLKRLDKQVQLQVEFVQNASHELRTPISVISGYNKLIDRWGMEDREVLKEALKAIKDETQNINSLIEKLLFLAKKDHLKLEKNTFCIKEMVDDINYEMSILYPNAKLSSNGDKNIKFTSDADLFKQLLRNLIKNGIVYSSEGKVSTDYYLEDSNLVLKIQDDGIGMEPEKIEKIFEKFYRVDKSRSREFGGHGLGLAIVKNILEVLGGEIQIESAPDKGTSIFLRFEIK